MTNSFSTTNDVIFSGIVTPFISFAEGLGQTCKDFSLVVYFIPSELTSGVNGINHPCSKGGKSSGIFYIRLVLAEG